ncbi:MAG TPA: trypsin-like peptidase domain-containing protein [Thermoleophilaceae bacterium]|nr:trypsin-like peptidase domain-containing protein [Thermoleophilaceae bacterium]
MTKTSPSSHIVSGVLGGLVAVVIGAILIATGAIDTGDDKTVVRDDATGAPVSVTPSGAQAGSAVNQIYKKVGPGVAFIQAKVERPSTSLFGDGGSGTAAGSGFALDKSGDILTNAHVVEGSQEGDVTVRFGKQDPVDAKVVGRDPSTDLAVLRIDPNETKITPLQLGDSSKVQVGDQAIAIGNPFGLENTVTTGIISAVQRSIDAPNGFSIDHVLQTDASINPGNSGGPLLDASGRVIGVNAQIATGGSNGSVGIGFAIPINTAKEVAPQLAKSGKVPHAYIGVTTAPVTPQVARDLNLPVDHGALVQDVNEGSPAAKAGIQDGGTETAEGLKAGGDLIVEIDGKPVREPQDIAAAISQKKPGDEISLKLYRHGDEKTVGLTLAERPEKAPGASQDPGGGGGILPLP